MIEHKFDIEDIHRPEQGTYGNWGFCSNESTLVGWTQFNDLDYYLSLRCRMLIPRDKATKLYKNVCHDHENLQLE